MKLPFKLFFLSLFFLVVCVYSFSDLGDYFSFESLKENQNYITSLYEKNKFFFTVSYSLIYIIMVVFSFPGATIMTLVSGLIFQTLLGSIIVSFVSTIGASLNFLIARYLFRDYLEKKFKTKLEIINQGLKKDGNLYLLSLRLIPIFPFFLINLLMGLTRVKLSNFFFISQLGMMPATVLYVNAGSKLSSLESLSDILSILFILSFTALGLLPVTAKYLIRTIRNT